MKTININNEEYVLKSDVNNLPELTAETAPYAIGTNYIIRTVTQFFTGRLIWVGDKELVLEDAAWVADTGRWYDALLKGVGVLKEVEPIGRVIVGRGSIVDCTEWKHDLPTKHK